MLQVCEGTKTKAEMLEETIDQYKAIFQQAKAEFETVVAVGFQDLLMKICLNFVTECSQVYRTRYKCEWSCRKA